MPVGNCDFLTVIFLCRIDCLLIFDRNPNFAFVVFGSLRGNCIGCTLRCNTVIKTLAVGVAVVVADSENEFFVGRSVKLRFDCTVPV